MNFKVTRWVSLSSKSQDLDFYWQAIAEVVGTKTETHVRQFFTKYRKSRNLDSICKESQLAQSEAKPDGAKLAEGVEVMEVVDLLMDFASFI